MAKVKKTKKNNQILKMFLLSLIICILIYAIYKVIGLIVNPTDTLVVENGTVSRQESVVGYVIRDESVIKSENEGNAIEQIKKEGEKVAKGNPVFKYYNIDEKEINTQIEELNVKIQEALEGQTNLFSSDVKAIEVQIERKIDELKNKNNIQEISEYKNDIETYVVKKATIAGSLSSAGTYINNLIDEKAKLENKLMKEAKYVYSPRSGVVSYKIDGLEEKLSITEFTNITKDLLDDLNLKTGQIVGSNDSSAKIVNNFVCYIAVTLSSEEAEEALVGDKVKIRLSDDKKVNATIAHINEEKNERVIIFKITEDVENLIAYRKISLSVIWWDYEGLRIPVSSILYENGASYVIRNSNGNLSKILVKVVKENENYCIVEPYDTDELKDLGYTAEEINSMKTIKMYDEVVVNPEME